MKLRPVRTVSVEMQFGGAPLPVGRLAWVERQVLFEFDRRLPAHLNPSPFQLREQPGSTVISGPGNGLFNGLHGVFNDSLPDGWGLLLMDRKLRSVGIQPGELTPLDRLAWIGDQGMGALAYRPEHPALVEEAGWDGIDLDQLAGEALLVLEDRADVVIDHLLRAGGSPAGARPKALVGRSPDGGRLVHGSRSLPSGYSHWLVKFGAREDPPDMGAIEMAYARMAREAGVAMPKTTLFPSQRGPGYFGMQRFDRGADGARLHMISLAGLLHADHRAPSLGYDGFLKATNMLTRRHQDVVQAYVRMVFNVLAHNRDDHTKNHAFLMGGDGEWRLSPAFDVVFSQGPGGEHSMDVAGEGRAPGLSHLLRVADDAGIRKKEAQEAIDRVRDAVRQWPEFAEEYGISAAMRSAVQAAMARNASAP